MAPDETCILLLEYSTWIFGATKALDTRNEWHLENGPFLLFCFFWRKVVAPEDNCILLLECSTWIFGAAKVLDTRESSTPESPRQKRNIKLCLADGLSQVSVTVDGASSGACTCILVWPRIDPAQPKLESGCSYPIRAPQVTSYPPPLSCAWCKQFLPGR